MGDKYTVPGTRQGLEQLGIYEKLGVSSSPDKIGADGRATMSFGLQTKNAIVAAVVGGAGAVVGGGKFANGAITGAFSRLYNDLLLFGGGISVVLGKWWGFDASAGIATTIPVDIYYTGGDEDVLITPDTRETGGYYTYGEGSGLYASADVFFGHYDGTIADLATPTDTINVGIGPIGFTVLFKAETWDYTGFTINIGPGLGGSYMTTNTTSSVWSRCPVPCED
jgi:hypothetical protein